MTKTRPSVTGQGPELFGRGIDLLFGEADEIPLTLPADLDEQKAPTPNRSQDTTMTHHRNDMKATAGANNADGESDHQPASSKILAEPVQTTSEPPASAEPLPLELGGAATVPLELGGDGPAEPLELGGSATTGALEAGDGMAEPSVTPAADQIEPIHTEVDELGNIVLVPTTPADSPPIALEESTMSEQPRRLQTPKRKRPHRRLTEAVNERSHLLVWT